MNALLGMVFFIGAVLLAIVGLSWLAATCIKLERRVERSNVSYAVSFSGALFLYTLGALAAKQALAEHTYNIVMPLAFALVPSFAAGLATFALRVYSRQLHKRG